MDVHFISLNELLERLAVLPFSSPLIILSRSGAERWGLSALLSDLHDNNKVVWYSCPDKNPTQETLYRIFNWLHGRRFDGIVAIGGGSVIDIAKAVSALKSMQAVDTPESILQAIVSKGYMENAINSLPIIAIPTTAGTGSEVTQWATIWDADGSAKYSVDARWLKPAHVWIVPQLASSSPPKLMLAAGLDAVCHAVEAHWAKASNPLSRALSIRALQLMTGNLKQGLDGQCDITIIEKLCTGALLSGLAFSETRTTACHSISYPLTYMFGMEHGFAVAITLSEIANINREACDISEILDVFSSYGGIHAWIDYMCDGIVSLRLGALGVNKQDIDRIAANSFSTCRMDNNPAELSINAVKRILRSVY